VASQHHKRKHLKKCLGNVFIHQKFDNFLFIKAEHRKNNVVLDFLAFGQDN